MPGGAGAIGGQQTARFGARKSKARGKCTAQGARFARTIHRSWLKPRPTKIPASGLRAPQWAERCDAASAVPGLSDGLLVEFILSTWALFRGGGGPRIGIEGCFYGR